jgi:hypothetical protein
VWFLLGNKPPKATGSLALDKTSDTPALCSSISQFSSALLLNGLDISTLDMLSM